MTNSHIEIEHELKSKAKCADSYTKALYSTDASICRLSRLVS